MVPLLQPGDGLLAVRARDVEPGQVRVFADPRDGARYLVKRVGAVRRAGDSATFEARSDNPGAPGVTDSRHFGWVPAADSYRVVLAVRGWRVRVVRTRPVRTG
ncbi:S26 family signal peptidase [Mycolicibacterium duvalii]|uniref:Uncharacterized protein n=1 Tax=Mycolicibacterium duvalii TaxID=39688 RepID=A0A7I7K7W9_9MYCO|nr:S26 family signal peptidase [Mycolicibacterium duvalii]MCV7368044.1 S26 family signal peptidase [Mycolicibacterium duvalii]PEG35055.1 S26 family signal peptidase [Mycolicibacterium duvalii]BBX19694.1 hypothetical protein MDUV_45540 [Mycolicibacterium duvalii]